MNEKVWKTEPLSVKTRNSQRQETEWRERMMIALSFPPHVFPPKTMRGLNFIVGWPWQADSGRIEFLCRRADAGAAQVKPLTQHIIREEWRTQEGSIHNKSHPLFTYIRDGPHNGQRTSQGPTANLLIWKNDVWKKASVSTGCVN